MTRTAHDGSATFTHSAIGGGYESATIASVTATEADDDTVGVTVSGDGMLSVPEGGSATYSVVLDTQPSGGSDGQRGKAVRGRRRPEPERRPGGC